MYEEYSQASGVILSKRDKTYIDISLAWEPNPLNGDITTLRNTRAIDNSIKNIIMTYPLEMPFNDEFGSEVTTLLFDPVDFATAGILELEIKKAIEADEPRVEIEEIKVLPDDDFMQFIVNISYKIVGSEQIFNVRQILTATR
jgi:phage baseplate assembly protein W